MGFADRLRDLLTRGSGKHQKTVPGAHDGQADGAGSGHDARTDQAAWHAAEKPAADHGGQAASTGDQTAGVADPIRDTDGHDQGTPGTSGQA